MTLRPRQSFRITPLQLGLLGAGDSKEHAADVIQTGSGPEAADHE